MRDLGVRGQGLEIDPEAVFSCVERGVPVMQTDLDEGLRRFPDQAFDVVVLEETLQTLRQPARDAGRNVARGPAGHGFVSQFLPTGAC